MTMIIILLIKFIDKIYLYVKDESKAKYQYLIKNIKKWS